MPRKLRSSFPLLGAVATLLPLLATGQNTLKNQPGYLVTTQGDTLRGLLDVPPLVTEQGVQFRPNAQASRRRFTVGELRAFGLQDGRRFVRRNIGAGRNSATGVVDSMAVLLQHLVAGQANFYRYDATGGRPSSQQAATQATQYFLSLAGGSLVPIRSATQNAALSAVFIDCPAVVEAVPRTPFTEEKLGNLVLRYNTLCHATTPSHDYRPALPPSTARLLVSVRGGLQRGQLWYSDASSLSRSQTQASTSPAFGVELRLANQGPWSLSAGIQYARLRSEAARIQRAFTGTVNADEPLTLPASVQVRSLQLPLLLRYTLGHAVLRPYLAAGPWFGSYLRNQTVFSYTKLTSVGGASYRTDVVAESPRNPASQHFTVGGAVRLGVQLKTHARISPLLEVQYSAGRDSDVNPGLSGTTFTSDLGDLYNRVLRFSAGLEF